MRSLLRRLVLLCAMLAWCPLPGAAEPWSAAELEQYDGRLRVQDKCISCAVEGVRLLLLTDESGTPAALVAAGDNLNAARRFASVIRFESAQESESENVLVMLAGGLNTKKRLTDNTPLQALAYLTEQNYYQPAELLEDGRVLWATGKRRSLDLLVPAVGSAPLRGVEIKLGTQLTEFAANVLARKLGYPADNSGSATKASIRGSLGADEVYYYIAARNAAVVRIGSRAFIGEGGADTFRRLTAAPQKRDFPAIRLPASPAPAGEAPSPVTRGESAPAPSENTPSAPAAELPPAEALKTYIRKLRGL